MGASHLFERLILCLVESQGKSVENDVLVVGASLVIDEQDEVLARILFSLYTDDLGSEDEVATEEEEQEEKVAPSEAAPAVNFIPSPSFAGQKPGYIFTIREGKVGYYLDVNKPKPAKILKAVDGTISPDDVKRAVDALILTDQIPVRKRVKEINEYPLKRYEVATSDDMIKGAIKSTKLMGDDPTDALSRSLSYEEFEKYCLVQACARGMHATIRAGGASDRKLAAP